MPNHVKLIDLRHAHKGALGALCSLRFYNKKTSPALTIPMHEKKKSASHKSVSGGTSQDWEAAKTSIRGLLSKNKSCTLCRTINWGFLLSEGVIVEVREDAQNCTCMDG